MHIASRLRLLEPKTEWPTHSAKRGSGPRSLDVPADLMRGGSTKVVLVDGAKRRPEGMS